VDRDIHALTHLKYSYLHRVDRAQSIENDSKPDIFLISTESEYSPKLNIMADILTTVTISGPFVTGLNGRLLPGLPTSGPKLSGELHIHLNDTHFRINEVQNYPFRPGT
jgi:hypothetical protein